MAIAIDEQTTNGSASLDADCLTVFNNGGPAFPQPCKDDGYAANSPFGVAGGGMSLRDYFAAQIAAGDWSVQSDEMGEWVNDTKQELLDERAVLYYRMADAMLRAKGNQ